MLQSLTIQNIVLIDQLEINFEQGLCVLTGETGAGKSILLDALGLVLGNRAETTLLQQGKDRGSVSAEFFISDCSALEVLLQEHGIEISDTLILRRTIGAGGKSRAFANDTPIALNFLQQIGQHLVEIHGQHEQKGLLNPANHRAILDGYGGLEGDVSSVSTLYRLWKDAEGQFCQAKQEAEKVAEQEDYLRHVKNELEELAPCAGEEEQLSEKRSLLQNKEKIIEILHKAEQELSDNNVLAAVRSASRILERSADSNDLFSSAIDALDKASIELEEAFSVIEGVVNKTDSDEDNLENIEERLFALRAAARKYKRPVEELPAYKEEIERQLSSIIDTEDRLKQLEELVSSSRAKFIEKAEQLSVRRSKAAQALTTSVMKELKPLKMSSCELSVSIENLPEEKWSALGRDKIQFLVRTNPGSAFGPLNKIASGGELSRFMLALKVIISGIKSTPTLIFDEIDTGIGGATADAVGQRLAKLAEHVQVLTVTHQPQVAAYGMQHLRVEKTHAKNITKTSIKHLSSTEKKEEVARMLAGASITDEARAAASKLIEA